MKMGGYKKSGRLWRSAEILSKVKNQKAKIKKLKSFNYEAGGIQKSCRLWRSAEILSKVKNQKN